MKNDEQGRWVRLWYSLFPKMPDFHSMLNRQCEIVVQATAELHAYMKTADTQHARRVVKLERDGDILKAENLAALQQAFATPFDREDIYRSIAVLDEIINYCRSTVTEMQILRLNPDEHTAAMSRLLHQGAVALRKGYANLPLDLLQVEASAQDAQKTEHKTERLYRKALAELFDAEHYAATLTPEQQQAENSLEVLMAPKTREASSIGSTVGFVLEVFKRRELYRHLSNTADRVAKAGGILNDIVTKIT